MHQQFNIQQLYVLPTLYFCVFYLSENKKRLVPLKHKQIRFYNRDEKCLLRGTNWVFKYSIFPFIFKGLIKHCTMKAFVKVAVYISCLPCPYHGPSGQSPACLQRTPCFDPMPVRVRFVWDWAGFCSPSFRLPF